MEIILVVFLKKIYLGQFGHSTQKMVRPHNFGSASGFFFKFCLMKGAMRYMKILLVVFREKISFGAI